MAQRHCSIACQMRFADDCLGSCSVCTHARVVARAGVAVLELLLLELLLITNTGVCVMIKRCLVLQKQSIQGSAGSGRGHSERTHCTPETPSASLMEIAAAGMGPMHSG